MSQRWAFLLFFVLGAGAGWTAKALRDLRADEPEGLRLEFRVQDGGIYRVRDISDGDTIILDNGLHVRYQGINTPERGRFIRDPAPFAEKAKDRNCELLSSGRVRLRLGKTPMDRYGRVLARVYALPPDVSADISAVESDIDVEMVLLREGLGQAMGLDMTNEEYRKLKAAEEEAKAAKRGIWGVTKEDMEQAAGEKPFCAAAGGEVFHRRECKSAERISPRNLQYYATIEEAIRTGRRACPRCLPDQAAKKAAPK